MGKIAALVFALLLAACAGSDNINWDNVRQLKIGMTEKEVTAELGSPYSVTAKSDGTQIWVWVNVNLLMGGTKSVSVIMKDGKAIQVPIVPASF